jgi:membrane-associated phospholipid phosphatase
MKSAQRVIVLALFFSLFCFSGVPLVLAADNSNTPTDVIKNFGDVLIYIVPAAAFGMTLGAKDHEGMKQFAESATLAMGIVVTLKYTVHSRRPNGDPQSFPSGHTAITFQGAEFLRKRYGWQYGLPAYVVAAYVGYSRVRSDEHFVRDVLAGAAIGFSSSFFITDQNKDWNIQPVAGASYLGVNLSHTW